MATPVTDQFSVEERLIYRTITWTLAFWVLGACYIVGSAIGWLLVGIWVARSVGWMKATARTTATPPFGVLLWIAGMAVLAVALVIGHLDFGLDLATLLKSSVGWMKGWALYAILPLVGASLAIRPAVIYRATNVLALQLLLIVPLLVLAAVMGLPTPLYTSPLALIGGAPVDFFEFTLYSVDPESNTWRWQFFAPWAPAAAFIGCLSFVMALYDKDPKWRWIGLISAVVVCLMTRSRMGLIAIPLLLFVMLFVANMTRSWVYATLGVLVILGLLIADPLFEFVADARNAFDAARASSSRVRSTLQAIAVHRWWSEAMWFGHGIVERGPHLVEFMPIGSHHTWNGLLFVKGMVGFVALAIPLAWTSLELLLKAQTDRVARAAFGVVLMLFVFSFGENLESLAYMCWPGLILIGIALRRRVVVGNRRWVQRSALSARPLLSVPAT